MTDAFGRGDGSAERAFPSLERDGQKLCAVCRAPVTGRRRRYCSRTCADDAHVRAGNSSRIRYLVAKRDAGICAACGVDTNRLGASLDRLASVAGDLRGTRQSKALGVLAGDLLRAACRRLRELGFDVDDTSTFAVYANLWQADHVVPVAEGGGGCGLEGFQTLCTPCHKRDTAELARRLAAARSPQLRLFEV